MARSLTSSMRDQLLADSVAVCLLANFEFDSKAGALRVWSGIGDLTFDGETYFGVGNLGSISAITETTELKATGMSFSMSGIASSQISLALNEDFQQRRVTLWLGFFDSSVSPGLLNTPIILFRGRMDTMDIQRGPETSTITINAESILIALERAPMRRYLSEDHNVDGLAPPESSGFTVYDNGFNKVPNIQEIGLRWGGGGPIA